MLKSNWFEFVITWAWRNTFISWVFSYFASEAPFGCRSLSKSHIWIISIRSWCLQFAVSDSVSLRRPLTIGRSSLFISETLSICSWAWCFSSKAFNIFILQLRMNTWRSTFSTCVFLWYVLAWTWECS